MIEGILVRELAKNVDERGFFSELLRKDWVDSLGSDEILQLNLSHSFPGVVRAWHRHLHGQVDYFICLGGAVKVCAYDDGENSKTPFELDEIVLSEERLRVARVPGILWHGYKALGDKPCKLLYATNRLYKYDDPDEERIHWNDPAIVPRTINGKQDERTGKPWDWNASPNK